MKRLNIAVIGAGVAGLSIAILAKQRGFDVTVFEREAQISTIGAGVTLWPNACFVIEKMKILESLATLGGQPKYLYQFDNSGDLKSRLDIGEVNDLSGFPTITILRRDLMKSLYVKLNELGGEVHFEKNISSKEVRTLQGEYDLVIGAEGRMSSVVRDTLFLGNALPRYQRFINIIGISPLKDAFFQDAIVDFRGNKERFGIVSVEEGRCYWAAAWCCEIDRERSKQSWYDEMKERFSAWCPVIPELIDKVDQDSLNRIFVHDMDPLPYWHKDNVLIIGDAAHAPLPTSGQGACQALEDAWHLVDILDQTDDLVNLEPILKRFYQTRFDKVTYAQNAGRAVANQIFFTEENKVSPAILPSKKQLSAIWMKGLL